MTLHFEPVTPDNRQDVERLQLLPEQRGFVEPVAQCLAEADGNRAWHPVGIYDGTVLVGFAMYGFFRWEYFPFGRLWLDRLLIDRRYQGRGYGKAAVAGLLARLESEHPGKKIYLSVIAGNDAAVRLYRTFGFQFNGEKDLHGEDVMVRRAGKPS